MLLCNFNIIESDQRICVEFLEIFLYTKHISRMFYIKIFYSLHKASVENKSNRAGRCG